MNTLQKNIINLHKEHGKQWLSELPRIIETLSTQWSLTEITPVNNMSWHYVAYAKQNNITPVVLKIGYDAKVIEDEYAVNAKYSNANGAATNVSVDVSVSRYVN